MESGKRLPPLGQGSGVARTPQRFAWHITELTSKSRKGPRTKLLQNIRGIADIGTFTAILGPSGAGKSLLLDCLALRNRDFRGMVMVDGRPFKGPFGSLAAFVYQTDLCFANLTVREHLVFQAFNRLGGSLTVQECRERADQVMKMLHLELVADSIIGGSIAGFISEGISGGERKRLNIGSELLTDPAILFLDEPTSGLDANIAEAVCMNLRRFAKEARRIVVASVHTPSSNAFSCFTHCSVLSWSGELTYTGSCDGMLPTMEALGFVCPNYYNPADFILKLSSRRLVDEECDDSADFHKSGASEGDYRRLVDAFSAKPSIADLAAEPTSVLPPPSEGGPSVNVVITSSYRAARPAGNVSLFWTNLRRSWIQQTRDVFGLVLLRIIHDIAVGVSVGLMHRGLVGRSSTHRTLLSVTLLTLVLNAFKAQSNGLLYMPAELQSLVRERYTSSNAAAPYYLASSVMAVVFASLQLCSPLLVNLISGHQIAPQRLALEISTHVLVHCASYWLAFTASAVSTASVVPVLFACSGASIEVSRASVIIRGIAYISFIRHGLVTLVLSHIGFLPDWDRQYILQFLEVVPEELDYYYRRLLLTTLCLWLAGLSALMIRVRVAKAV